MVKQRQMQKCFLESVLGGDGSLYKGRDMYEAHKTLKCNNKNFDDISGILVDALIGFQVDKDTIQEIGNILETTRQDIVTVPDVVELSLYEKIGQEPAISIAIDNFYRNVLQDPAFSYIFQGKNLENVKNATKKFVNMITGGP